MSEGGNRTFLAGESAPSKTSRFLNDPLMRQPGVMATVDMEMINYPVNNDWLNYRGAWEISRWSVPFSILHTTSEVPSLPRITFHMVTMTTETRRKVTGGWRVVESRHSVFQKKQENKYLCRSISYSYDDAHTTTITPEWLCIQIMTVHYHTQLPSLLYPQCTVWMCSCGVVGWLSFLVPVVF